MTQAWDALRLSRLPRGQILRVRLNISSDAAGRPYPLPVLLARGQASGPVFGLTAMVHGNEVNGALVIHRLFKELNLKKLKGTVVALPVVNLPGYLRNIREFLDGADLNRHMPGRANGTPSQIYNHQLIKKAIAKFNYLIDLHTASFGRANSLYVRGNLEAPVTEKMARLLHPQIIVNNTAADGSLRHACHEREIPAITLEVGNPLVIQDKLVDISLHGVRNVMAHLGMLPKPKKLAVGPPVVCQRSYWMYADRGGILEVLPGNAERLRKGQLIARVFDLFGHLEREFHAPEDGVVVGKSTNPICYAGSRILHLGVDLG